MCHVALCFFLFFVFVIVITFKLSQILSAAVTISTKGIKLKQKPVLFRVWTTLAREISDQ